MSRLRSELISNESSAKALDLRQGRLGWAQELPSDLPTILVCDGPMAMLAHQDFVGPVQESVARVRTDHLQCLQRVAMRNSRRSRGRARIPAIGLGVGNAHDIETWSEGTRLVEEVLIARAPKIADYLPLLCAITRLSSRS